MEGRGTISTHVPVSTCQSQQIRLQFLQVPTSTRCGRNPTRILAHLPSQLLDAQKLDSDPPCQIGGRPSRTPCKPCRDSTRENHFHCLCVDNGHQSGAAVRLLLGTDSSSVQRGAPKTAASARRQAKPSASSVTRWAFSSWLNSSSALARRWRSYELGTRMAHWSLPLLCGGRPPTSSQRDLDVLPKLRWQLRDDSPSARPTKYRLVKLDHVENGRRLCLTLFRHLLLLFLRLAPLLHLPPVPWYGLSTRLRASKISGARPNQKVFF